MTIHPGPWSNGQLGARICWDGLWSGSAVGALVATVLHGWLTWFTPGSDPASVVAYLAFGIPVGAVLGLATGIIAALVTMFVTRRPVRRHTDSWSVAVFVLVMTSLAELVVGPAVLGGLTVVCPVLAAGPLVVLVRREVRREQLQDLAVTVR